MPNKNSKKTNEIIENLSLAILGKYDVIEKLLVGIFANGHILFEDVPGVGKTTLVKGLAKAIGCEFQRVQCTPDLLPADITGVSIYNQNTGEWDFQKGPIFTQVLLADEINRTSPKTQSALLESMEEKQVTVDGNTHQLDEPFFVLATQNPQEYEGTFPLPESQLDRFTMKLTLGYPPPQDEKKILINFTHQEPLEFIEQKISPAALKQLQQDCEAIYIEDTLLNYLTAISQSTREHPQVELGISPRGTLHMVKCAKALAFIRNRDYVLPDDIQELVMPVYSHRLVLNQAAYLERKGKKDILEEIVSNVQVPGNAG